MRARVKIVVGVASQHDLRLLAVANWDWDQRSSKQMVFTVRISSLPEASGFLHAIAERVHDEDGGRQHDAALRCAGQIAAPDAFPSWDAIHVKHEGIDPLHLGV